MNILAYNLGDLLLTDVILILAMFIISCVDIWIAFYAEKVLSHKWRLFYILPALAAFIHLAFTGFEISLLPVYIGAVVLTAGFCLEKKNIRLSAGIISAAFSVIAVVAALNYTGYRVPDLYEEFNKGFDAIREHYCLAEYKNIDFDDMYARYSPRFKGAAEAKDEVTYTLLWKELTSEFKDGHTGYLAGNEDVHNKACEIAYGNDYGFSIIELSDGSYVAVNVADGSAAKSAGINNGTEIKTMDGCSMEDMKHKVKYVHINESDKENAEFYKALYIAGLGGDTATFEYMDDAGNIRTVTLEKQGAYYYRLDDTVLKLDDGAKTGHLTWLNVNEDTVLLRIKLMLFDTDTYMETDYREMEGEIREKLIAYKGAGYNNVIIDLRSNSGGSPHMVSAIAKLFDSEGEHFYFGSGSVDEKTGNFIKDETTGKYKMTSKLCYTGENLWGHGNIIVLVNGQCASGGDHLAWLFDRMDNAKLYGFTKTHGVGQGTNGVDLKTGSLSFSAVPVFDEDGEVFIDAKRGENAGTSIDEKIPLTSEAVKAIFDNGEDYVLNYVMQYY